MYKIYSNSEMLNTLPNYASLQVQYCSWYWHSHHSDIIPNLHGDLTATSWAGFFLGGLDALKIYSGPNFRREPAICVTQAHK